MYKLIIKRLLDIICSIFLVILVLPFMLIISLMIKITMGSPILFIQKRIGYKNKIFNIIKFRTMTNERDIEGKLINDAKRITKLGNFLRKSSLDELPELWCIFKGDMSFVGPRPLSQYYLQYYTDEEVRRHDVRPGLTGLAQINGRNAIDWETRFKYDIEYIDTLSFINDVKILLKTVGQVIRKEDILMRGEGEVGDLDEIRKIKKSKQFKR